VTNKDFLGRFDVGLRRISIQGLSVGNFFFDEDFLGIWVVVV
jgi:hypothetical protein